KMTGIISLFQWVWSRLEGDGAELIRNVTDIRYDHPVVPVACSGTRAGNINPDVIAFVRMAFNRFATISIGQYKRGNRNGCDLTPMINIKQSVSHQPQEVLRCLIV